MVNSMKIETRDRSKKNCFVDDEQLEFFENDFLSLSFHIGGTIPEQPDGIRVPRKSPAWQRVERMKDYLQLKRLLSDSFDDL